MKKKVKKASSGQSGPRIKDLTRDKLIPKAQKILDSLRRKSPRSLWDLAEVIRSKSTSPVRNAVRRLVRGRLVKKVGRGAYAAVK